jgi:hypothetical protein
MKNYYLDKHWVQFYLSVKDKIVFSSKIELPAGSPLSKNSTINNIILYNARGILFVDDSNHTEYSPIFFKSLTFFIISLSSDNLDISDLLKSVRYEM